jgi:hypothetical protein
MAEEKKILNESELFEVLRDTLHHSSVARVAVSHQGLIKENERLRKERDEWDAENQNSLRRLMDRDSEIATLKTRLAEYEPQPVDTKEQAAKKLIGKLEQLISDGDDFEVQFNDNSFFVAKQDWPDGAEKPYSGEFPYREPGELEKGDLVYYRYMSGDPTLVWVEGYFVFKRFSICGDYGGSDGNIYDKSHCIPTGFKRVENGRIVPKETKL